MQNPIQKFRQIVFEKLGILPRKLKTLTSTNCRRVEYFFPKILHPFPTCHCLQRVFGIFLFGDLESFAKIRNNLVSTVTETETIFYFHSFSLYVISFPFLVFSKNFMFVLFILIKTYTSRSSKTIIISTHCNVIFAEDFLWILFTINKIIYS